MTSRRMGLLSLGVVLVLALVGPATAAATNVWQHEGTPLKEHVQMSLHGSQVFVTEAGGMICEVDAVLTAEAGSTGRVTNFQSKQCVGLFGELTGCTVKSSKQFGPFWHLQVNTGSLTAKEVAIVRELDEGCPVERVVSNIPKLTTLLPEPAAIGVIEYFGSGEAAVDGVPGEYEEFGSWAVTPEDTYGIG